MSDPKPIRVIIIDPETRSVSEGVLEGDRLDAMQAIVGGMIACAGTVADTESEDLWVNDEALLGSPEAFFFMRGFDPMAGRAFIARTDGEGESMSSELTIEFVRDRVVFMNSFQLRVHLALRSKR